MCERGCAEWIDGELRKKAKATEQNSFFVFLVVVVVVI